MFHEYGTISVFTKYMSVFRVGIKNKIEQTNQVLGIAYVSLYDVCFHPTY
jgi:hypothetical protein